MTKKKKSIYPLWVILPAIVVYTIFSVVPIVISLVCSFTDWNMGRLYTPVFRGLANYVELLKDPVFLRSIGNTFLFALATTVLKTVVGFLALDLAMGKKDTRKRADANHLLCTMCYQYYSGWSII